MKHPIKKYIDTNKNLFFAGPGTDGHLNDTGSVLYRRKLAWTFAKTFDHRIRETIRAHFGSAELRSVHIRGMNPAF